MGVGCNATDRPDPQLAARIERALSDSRTVVDGGAGTSAYMPVDREVVAVESSTTVAAQRRPGSAPVECAHVESPSVASEAGRRARGMLRGRAFVALLGCLGLLAAGCGGGSGSPSVARLGSTAVSASGGGGSAALTQQQEVSIDVAYAACLNRHGVKVAAARTGGLVWAAGPGVPGPGSPQVAGAERDCKSVLPKGGLPSRPTAAQNSRALAQLLRYARCIRAHGIPNFPDPTSQGLRISPSSGIDLNSPQFLAAQKSCQSQSLTLAGAP
jgi:hypothetical protein